RVVVPGVRLLGAGDPAELAEVLDRAEMDVRGLPPGVRKIVGAGHVTAEQQLQSDAPVTEVWERNHGMAANAQHVFEYQARMPGRLQGLRKNNVVECV